MQMPAFVHQEQEDGPAADAGCRRLSRTPFCGALKDLSAGNQSAGAAELRAAPRWGRLSASLQEGPPREPSSLVGSPSQALAPDALSRPQLPHLHRGMFRRAGQSACSLLESFYPGTRRRLPFRKRSEAISKEINRQDNFK